jgi:flagellin-specific chaperone FliS
MTSVADSTDADPRAGNGYPCPACGEPTRGLTLLDAALACLARARGCGPEHPAERSLEIRSARLLVARLRAGFGATDELMTVNMGEICEYLSRQLAAVERGNSIALLDEVAGLLREIRSASLSLSQYDVHPGTAQPRPAGSRVEGSDHVRRR